MIVLFEVVNVKEKNACHGGVAKWTSHPPQEQ
jgi:hypothetical protein